MSAHDQRFRDPDCLPSPLPFARVEPERGEAWCPGGGKPDGLEFLGCRATTGCFVLPCPCCLVGWVPIVPDGSRFGYRLACEVGCTGDFASPWWPDAGCDPVEIAFQHAVRCAELPAPMPVEPDHRAKRYSVAVISRIVGELPAAPTADQLRDTAHRCGQWLEAGGLPAEPVAAVLLRAASRAGLDTATVGTVLAGACHPRDRRHGRPPRLPGRAPALEDGADLRLPAALSPPEGRRRGKQRDLAPHDRPRLAVHDRHAPRTHAPVMRVSGRL